MVARRLRGVGGLLPAVQLQGVVDDFAETVRAQFRTDARQPLPFIRLHLFGKAGIGFEDDRGSMSILDKEPPDQLL